MTEWFVIKVRCFEKGMAVYERRIIVSQECMLCFFYVFSENIGKRSESRKGV